MEVVCTVFSLIQVEVSSIIVPTLFKSTSDSKEFIDLSVVSVIRIRAGVRCGPEFLLVGGLHGRQVVRQGGGTPDQAQETVVGAGATHDPAPGHSGP